jgi:hypothetical protein
LEWFAGLYLYGNWKPGSFPHLVVWVAIDLGFIRFPSDDPLLVAAMVIPFWDGNVSTLRVVQLFLNRAGLREIRVKLLGGSP